MSFFSACLVKSLVAIQICVALMMGSFDSAQPLGGPEMDLEAATPPPPMHRVSPLIPIRRPIAVQGVVFCKSCKVSGFNPFAGASPLPGAIVTLVCKSGRSNIEVTGKTDNKGYFFIQAENVTTFRTAGRCKMFLTSSPLEKCKKPTNINGGVTGDRLRFEKVLTGSKPVDLYSTGPFVSGPATNTSCPHSP